MGVLNVTPDSFSDGGAFLAADKALRQAQTLYEKGAEIIDIGAESTRPGSDQISPAEQIGRLRDVVGAIAERGVHVSIDTTCAQVAEFALQAGADIINDVSAGRSDPDMLPLAAKTGAPIILMHMLGEPRTMQADPRYRDVVSEVFDFLAERIEAAVAAGVRRDRIIIDPGIGFGKRLEHNLALLAGVGRLLQLDRPVLVGPSRKRFIGELTGVEEPQRRRWGTIAACLACRQRGATILRVHDVGGLLQALAVADAIDAADDSKNAFP